LAAIKNNQFALWTGLTYEGVRKDFPESEETWKGHGKKVKSGLRSTRKGLKAEAVIKLEDNVEQEAHYKQSSQIYKKSKTIMVRVMQIDVDDEGKEMLRLIYTDGTGRFPKQSRTGMNYIMVLAENDSDAILVEAMRNWSAGKMVRAYSVLIERLHACGIFPTKQVLDNEISQEYKDATSRMSWSHHTITNRTRLNEQFKPSRTTSCRSSAALTRISHFIYGRISYDKQSIH
jgi:hypothetical protein